MKNIQKGEKKEGQIDLMNLTDQITMNSALKRIRYWKNTQS